MDTRWPLSILVLSTTVLASAVIPIGAQHPGGGEEFPAHETVARPAARFSTGPKLVGCQTERYAS
jgi:hypothetical protein